MEFLLLLLLPLAVRVRPEVEVGAVEVGELLLRLAEMETGRRAMEAMAGILFRNSGGGSAGESSATVA